MRIIVTGGSGFLGSHVVDTLCARGDEVLVIDREESTRVRERTTAAEYLRASCADSVALERIRAGADALVHVAAQVNVMTSWADPARDAQENILDTIAVTQAAIAGGVQQIIFISSAAVYGDALPPITEVTPCMPATPYGAAKMAAEAYVRLLCTQAGVAWRVLRPSNILGARQQCAADGSGGVMPRLLHRLLVTDEPFLVYGNGTSTRDYCAVEDVARAVLFALDDRASGIWNVSTNVEVALRDLIALLLEIHGSAHPLEQLPARPGEVLRNALCADRITQETGWHPEISLRESVERAYAWYRTHIAHL